MAYQSTGRLGHFLPYLLGRQLRAVFWPAGAGKFGVLLVVLLAGVYGIGLGYLLRHHDNLPANTVPKLLAGLNTVLFVTALAADFLPSYRTVQRPLPEPLPVSARLNTVTAFVLDLVSIRKGIMLVFLLLALAAAPEFWRPLGLALLVWLSATALSFNLRLLLSMGRWWHPLFWLNLLCIGAAAFWLGREFEALVGPAAYWAAALAVGGPLLLWTVALVLVAPRFSARYMPEPAHAAAPSSSWLARLSPEWKMYLRKTWPILLMGIVVKVGLLAVGGYFIAQGKEEGIKMFFYVAFLPVVGFTYVNHNLLGYLWAATANHLERLGLTPHLLWQYLRLAGSVVLVDSLLSTLLLLVLYPARMWPLLGLLPLVMPPLLALGVWGSLEKAKAIRKNIDLNNMRNNVSSLINILTVALVAALYFMPWWARVALALVVTLSALVPVRRIVSNHGPTRRQLWRRLTHE